VIQGRGGYLSADRQVHPPGRADARPYLGKEKDIREFWRCKNIHHNHYCLKGTKMLSESNALCLWIDKMKPCKDERERWLCLRPFRAPLYFINNHRALPCAIILSPFVAKILCNSSVCSTKFSYSWDSLSLLIIPTHKLLCHPAHFSFLIRLR